MNRPCIISNPPHMEVQECVQPGGFGVSVELSAVFSDERARCWVWVEARRPVRWLLARLLAAILCPPPTAPLALLAPRGLLLPDDPLALLQPNDTVRVVPVDFDLFATAGTHNEQSEKQLDGSPISEQISLSQEITAPHSRGAEALLSGAAVASIPTPVPAPAPVSALASVPASPPCSPASPPLALQEMKQRALELLEQYVTPHAPSPLLTAAPSEPPPSPLPARARRRRVRRRRRPADSDTADETDAPPPVKVPTLETRYETPSPAQAARDPTPTPSPSPNVPPERAACGRGGCGLRGGPPPRLVRAL